MASIAEELEAAQTIYKEYLRCKQESEDLAEIASKHLMDAVDHLERAGSSMIRLFAKKPETCQNNLPNIMGYYNTAVGYNAQNAHHGLLNKESNMVQSDHDPVRGQDVN